MQVDAFVISRDASECLFEARLTLQVGTQFRSFSNIELDLGFVQFWYIGLICLLQYLLSSHPPPAVTRCFASHKCTFRSSPQVFDCRCRDFTRSTRHRIRPSGHSATTGTPVAWLAILEMPPRTRLRVSAVKVVLRYAILSHRMFETGIASGHLPAGCMFLSQIFEPLDLRPFGENFN